MSETKAAAQFVSGGSMDVEQGPVKKKARKKPVRRFISGPTLAVLKRVVQNELMLARRTFPFDWHYQFGITYSPHPDNQVEALYVQKLVELKLIDSHQNDPLVDERSYFATDAGRHIVAHGLPVVEDAQIDLLG